MFIRRLASTWSSAEENLIHDDNYQEETQAKLIIIIDRHCAFIRWQQNAMMITSNLIMPFAMGIIVIAVSYGFAFLQEVIWWPNYVLSVLLVTNTYCIITAGHLLEDESEKIFLELTTLQWYTWNMKNKKLFLTILTAAIRPINVKFSENFVVNNRMLLFASFTIPAVTYQVFYVTQHVTMQMKLFKMFIRSLASTLSSTEENLTLDDNYQEAIQTQLKIIIDRHCDFIRWQQNTLIIMTMSNLIMPFAIGIVIFALSYAFAFLQEVIWWPNYVLSVLLLANTYCVITAGHVLEDESEKIFLELTTLQWYTWNMKNKKLFLTILTAAIRPINVKFSENFVVNNRMLLFVIELWPLDSVGDETRRQIASLSKWINGVAVTCTSLILLCTILLVFADDRDNGLAFIRSIFDELFTTWGKILFVIFKMTIPLVSFTLSAPTYQAIYSARILVATSILLVKNGMIDDIMDVIDLWRVDSADEKTKNEITELSKWANRFVATNTSVCLLCIATVSFSSNENDGLEFIRYVLDQIFSQWGKLALVLIKMSLLLASFTMPGVTYQLFYVTQHIRMQMKLFKMFIRSLANTLSSTEENLTHDNNYQEEIHTQLKIIIDRHCDFIRHCGVEFYQHFLNTKDHDDPIYPPESHKCKCVDDRFQIQF
ncbi:hypothetical protein GEV33_003932 [Tenebrio molitor]|uniref:Uncharacterized protein n=1 Tax=Tenebrio molitor TaxID=7067 RepID=A0A8J6LDV1_TENMO|nr:hypothetical protein GEV33_003932 [Tenebrio molitor]